MEESKGLFVNRGSSVPTLKKKLMASVHEDMTDFEIGKTKSAVEKIPRPPNAFMIFAKDYRRQLAGINPDDSNKQISHKLGDMWKSLDNSLKQSYFEKARIEAYNHKMKYPDYVYNPKEARKRKEIEKQNRLAAKGLIAKHQTSSTVTSASSINKTQTMSVSLPSVNHQSQQNRQPDMQPMVLQFVPNDTQSKTTNVVMKTNVFQGKGQFPTVSLQDARHEAIKQQVMQTMESTSNAGSTTNLNSSQSSHSSMEEDQLEPQFHQNDIFNMYNRFPQFHQKATYSHARMPNAAYNWAPRYFGVSPNHRSGNNYPYHWRHRYYRPFFVVQRPLLVRPLTTQNEIPWTGEKNVGKTPIYYGREPEKVLPQAKYVEDYSQANSVSDPAMSRQQSQTQVWNRNHGLNYAPCEYPSSYVENFDYWNQPSNQGYYPHNNEFAYPPSLIPAHQRSHIINVPPEQLDYNYWNLTNMDNSPKQLIPFDYSDNTNVPENIPNEEYTTNHSFSGLPNTVSNALNVLQSDQEQYMTPVSAPLDLSGGKMMYSRAPHCVAIHANQYTLSVLPSQGDNTDYRKQIRVGDSKTVMPEEQVENNPAENNVQESTNDQVLSEDSRVANNTFNDMGNEEDQNQHIIQELKPLDLSRGTVFQSSPRPSYNVHFM